MNDHNEEKTHLFLENETCGSVKFSSEKAGNLHFLDDNKMIDETIQIRANLMKQLSSQPEIVLVTSGHRGAGVSTVALNLSAMMAEHPEQKVLLIDENLKNPTLTRGFEVEHSFGLYDLLEKKARPENPIHKTSITDLYFMGVGNCSDSATGIGRSLQIDNLFNELRQYFSLIIIDCQPIEPDPETIYLAGKAGNVLLVFESEVSRREVVENNKKRLENMGAKIVGAVLNRRRFYIPSWLYKIV